MMKVNFNWNRQQKNIIVTLPVEKISSAVFGGPAWDTLYVTTAGGDRESGSADGTLYALQMPVTGKPEFESRIMLCPD